MNPKHPTGHPQNTSQYRLPWDHSLVNAQTSEPAAKLDEFRVFRKREQEKKREREKEKKRFYKALAKET